MSVVRYLRSFFSSEKSETGQVFVLFAFLVLFVILFGGSFALDKIRVNGESDRRDEAAKSACWNGSVTKAMGGDWQSEIQAVLARRGYGDKYHGPQEGSGAQLSRGITMNSEPVRGIPVPVIRVAIWGPAQTTFHHYLQRYEEWPAGGRWRCTSGLGGVLPILIKEYEDDPDWSWGDSVVMFGDGWDPNEGPNQAPTGIGNPDIICVNGGPSGDCSDRIYRDPPAPEGAQVNTLKSIVMGYMTFGYDGPLHSAGTYIPRQSGVNNHQTVQAFLLTHGVGDHVAVMIIRDGSVYSGEKGFDNVEVIGYAIFQVDGYDANTVWGHPVTGILTSTGIKAYPLEPELLNWE